jgi:hypothetical protein
VVEHAWLGDGSEGPVRVDLALSIDEHERTWPYPFTEPRWDMTAILRHLAADAEHHAP